MTRYEVISKADIPPTPSSCNRDRYGEWLAMARTLLLCGTDRALKIRLDGLTHATAISSFHRAARQIGLKLSTMREGDILYVTRTGTGEGNEKKPFEWTCRFCGATGRTTKPTKVSCGSDVCQKKRHAANARAQRARLKGAK